MLRMLAIIVASALFLAPVRADSIRKKDVVEPPPEKPVVEPAKKTSTKPRVEPPREAPPPGKPKIDPPTQRPQPARPKSDPGKSGKDLSKTGPEKPNVKPSITQSPFTRREPTPPEKVAAVKKPAVDTRTVRKSPPTASRSARGSYVHAVMIPLKLESPRDTADKMIADCHKLLARIPVVRNVKAGLRADEDSRGYVKRDYRIGLLVFVDDYDALKTYLEHPLQLQFADKYKKHIDFERLHVYDFVDGR